MALSRRDFLGRSGAALAGWGLAEAIAAQRVAQVLAEPTGRRKALLIGINQYEPTAIAPNAASVALEGCLNDVALWQELLTSRLGFQAADVVTLTDRTAGRAQWQAALEDCAAGLRAGDAVVWQFSGYGGLLADGTGLLVPVDGHLAVGTREATPSEPIAPLRDWSEVTIQDWLRSLPTERVLGVVDAGFAPAPAQAWVRHRSRPVLTPGVLDPEELAWQQQLRRARSGRSTAASGWWLRASQPDRPALELPQSGFVAGAFTWALVQQLWNSLPASTLWFDLARTAAQVTDQGGQQQPIAQRLGAAAIRENIGEKIGGNIGENLGQWLATAAGPSAGTVLATDSVNRTVTVSLAGLAPAVLAGATQGLILEPAATNSADDTAWVGGLRITSRNGWRAIGQPVAEDSRDRPVEAFAWQPGQLLRERWRILSRNLELQVALDPNFERIERIDATSAFDALSHVTVVNPENRAIDAWFARAARPTANPDPNGDEAKTAYGLWRPGQTLWPNTVGEGGEALKTAVQRLGPQLHSLLARKLWRATLNQGAGWPVRITLAALETPDRPLLQWSTLPNVGGAIGPNGSIAPATFTSGSRPQLTLENAGTVPLWALVLQLDSLGRATLVQDLGQDTEPGQTLLAPNSRQTLSWPAAPSRGWGSLLVWLSRDPLERVQASLPSRQTGEGDRLWPLAQPLALARQLLEDLQQISVNHAAPPSRSPSPDSYTLDCRQWMAWELPFRLI